MNRTWAEGEATGYAMALLTVLGARGIKVPAHVQSKITACTDADQLNMWIKWAATAERIEDVL
jgi:hypothetical protein